MAAKLHLLTILATCTLAPAPVVADSPVKALPDFIAHKTTVSSVAFSPDGNFLAVAGGELADPREKTPAIGELSVWDLKTRKRLMTFEGNKEFLDTVVFSPDGKYLASSSSDNIVRLWDVATGKQVTIFDDSHRVLTLSFSPDGKTLAGSVWPSPSDGVEDWDGDAPPGSVLLWDIEKRALRIKLEGHAGPVHQVAFSPDGKTVGAVSGAWNPKASEFKGWYKHGEIKLWDPTTGKVKKTFTGHKGGRINTVAFSPDGKTLATGCVVRSGEHLRKLRGEVTVWDVATGRDIVTTDVNKVGVQTLAFSHDGKLLAATSMSPVKSLNGLTGEIAILDSQTLKTSTRLTDLENPYYAVFSPVKRILASPDATKVKLWDLSEVVTGADKVPKSP